MQGKLVPQARVAPVALAAWLLLSPDAAAQRTAASACRDGNAPPILTVESPTDGDLGPACRMVELRATARDPEDGDLTAAVRWTSSLDGSLGPGGCITTLSVGTHLLTASVSDGCGAVTSRSLSYAVLPNEPPVLVIDLPADGSMATAGATVVLRASAFDSDDGELSAAIGWTSDRDGPLGVGGSLAVVLSTGAHVITASVTDSCGEGVGDRIDYHVGIWHGSTRAGEESSAGGNP